MTKTPKDVNKYSEEELLEWLEEKVEYIDSRKRKPGHGICCTCQRCGHVYDDCLCGDEEFYEQIKEMIQKPQVTEEWIEEKAKELMAKLTGIHPWDDIRFKEYAQDFIRSLIEDVHVL